MKSTEDRIIGLLRKRTVHLCGCKSCKDLSVLVSYLKKNMNAPWRLIKDEEG